MVGFARSLQPVESAGGCVFTGDWNTEPQPTAAARQLETAALRLADQQLGLAAPRHLEKHIGPRRQPSGKWNQSTGKWKNRFNWFVGFGI